MNLCTLFSVVILIPVPLAFAQDSNACSNEFSYYMSCLQNGMLESYDTLEREYYNDLQAEVKRCFSPLPSQSQFCLFTAKDFTRNWFGRSTGCKKCDELKNQLMRRIFFESEAARRCATETIFETVYQDMLPCVRKKLGKDFQLYQMPDFDKKAYKFKDYYHASGNLFAAVEQRLDKCDEMDSEKWDRTQSCLEYGSLSIRNRHCKVADQCIDAHSEQCPHEAVMSSFSTACQCIYTSRFLFSSRAESIIYKVMKDRGTAEQCVSTVEKLLKSRYSAANWKSTLGHILSKCTAKPPQMTLHGFISSACKEAAEGNGRMLKIGMQVLTTVIDSVLDRLGRFCPCTT